jgi:acyl-CoA synthetase (AMP-forming)/AMP-acid ligase II
VWELLAAGRDDAVAIAAPARASLTYHGLRDQVTRTIAALNRCGIGRNDRVAIVLPNGPEMASAFVSMAAGASAAPLNPAYRLEEFQFYLSDLGADAVIVMEGVDSPVVTAAAHLGIPLMELRVTPGAPAGSFELFGDGPGGEARATGLAGPDDVALILHTSGTTSRPKIVPLTHRNLVTSAASIRSTLLLTERDRCLNVMPLFHIHGLMAALLAPLGAGGSIFCTSGFDAFQFFAWLDEAGPSYYTAVPTMHQAVLARAPRNHEVIDRHRLRFIRSSSAALPPRVMAALEETFAVPVIEAYAMTEASHQMTSNGLPPNVRRPGTVGVAAGPEVSVMDSAGRLLPPGSVGEVVIRGPNVTGGYENNPEANATSFTDGWFRTGDQGVMDEDGFFTLTGRLKEIINRGGEKISPNEVEAVLLDHPSVQQAVVFAVPHEKLGEEVAAAVVLREAMEASPEEIRGFTTARLAAFKVPVHVLIVGEIPKGPTGKLRRIGLAAHLGFSR